MHRQAVMPIRATLLGCITAAIILSGCDAGIYFIAENHTQAPVRIRYFVEEACIAPCSVEAQGFMLVPFVGWPRVDYTVVDENGNELARGDVRLRRRVRLAGAMIGIIRYPSRPNSLCPDAVTDRYRVRVSNLVEETVRVSLGDVELGEMEPGESLVVGPLKGRIWDAPELAVSGPDGQNRINGRDLGFNFDVPNYTLGDTPVVHLTIVYAFLRDASYWAR